MWACAWLLVPLATAQLEPFSLPASFEGTWQGVPYASVVGPWSENFTFAITKLPEQDYLLHCPGPRDPKRKRVAMMQAHTVSDREVTFCLRTEGLTQKTRVRQCLMSGFVLLCTALYCLRLRKWPGYDESKHPFPFHSLGCYKADSEEGCGCFNWTLRVDESGTRMDYQVSMAGSPFELRSRHVWATLQRIPYVAAVNLEFPGSGAHFDCDYHNRDEHQTELARCPFAFYYRPPPETSTVAASAFKHCYNLDAQVGLVLEWDIDEQTSSLHVQISALSNVAEYVSLGFRPLGGSSSLAARKANTGREQRFGMAGADIVLGSVTGGVQQYYSSAYSGAPEPDQSLTIRDASVERRGGRVFLRFRRPLIGGWLYSHHGITASIASNVSDMIWAVGTWSGVDQAPSYHGALRGWREVNWTDPEFDSRPLLSLRPYRCGLTIYP